MKSTIKILLILITSVLTILTAICGLAFLNRLTLSYNSEGRYFDENKMIVYHQQSIIGYGFLTFIFLMATIFFAYWTIQKFKLKKIDKILVI